MTTLLAPGIFLFTLLFVIWRPRQVNESIPALVGAGIALASGIVTWHDFWFVGKMVWNATFALIAIMLISAVLDQAGFFNWAAFALASRCRGCGLRLFFVVVILGSLITIFFNNDGTVLILTPIILGMVNGLGWNQRAAMPYLIACGFIADTASTPLVVSNLVNILTADYLGLGFSDYVAKMWFPGLLAILASAIILRLFFRHDIPVSFDQDRIPTPMSGVRDRWLCQFGLGVLGLVVIGYFIGSFYHVPVSLVAALGALVLLAAAIYRGTIDTRRVVKEAPWPIVAFALGMYLVVYGMGSAGLTSSLTMLLNDIIGDSHLKGSLYAGTIFAVMAAFMNNLPSAMTSSLSVAAMQSPVQETVALASVVGNAIGPKLTPIGSLATLMWLHILRQKGITISWVYYFKVGIIITPPVLAAALMGVYLVSI